MGELGGFAKEGVLNHGPQRAPPQRQAAGGPHAGGKWEPLARSRQGRLFELR